MKSKAAWYQEVAVHIVVREQEAVDTWKSLWNMAIMLSSWNTGARSVSILSPPPLPPAADSPSPMNAHSLPPPTAPAKAPVTLAAGGSAEEPSGTIRAPGAGTSCSAHRRRCTAEAHIDPLSQVPFDAPA